MLTFLPGKEAIHLQQAVPPRQLLTFPQVKEAILPQQLLSFLPAKEAVLPWQLLTFLPGKEAIHPQQAVPPRQLLTFLPVKAAILPPAIAFLPSGEGGSSPQAGHSNNQTRSGRQGLRWSNRHRAPQTSQENSTVSWEDNTTAIPLLGSPKGLLVKILSLSGSLTFPTNP